MRAYINSQAPGALFITGDYKPTYGFDGYVASTDKVMFTAYKRWWEYPVGEWAPFVPYPPFTSVDQRWNWEYYKNRYGYKSASNWINIKEDNDEYSDLLGKAKNLGLNEIWLYQLEDNSQTKLETYCNRAWKKYWLDKIERKYIYVYHCYEKNYEDCENNNSWVLYEVITTDEFRTVNP